MNLPFNMAGIIEFLPFVIFILIGVIVIFTAVYLEKKRTKELESLAAQAGLVFQPGAEALNNLRTDYSPSDFEKYRNIYAGDPVYSEKKDIFSGLFNSIQPQLEFTGLEIFNLGRSRKAINLILVPFSGNNLYFFDYRYTTGSGKNSSKHNFTVALMKTSLDLPNFTLRPENFLDKIGSFLGFKDINFDTYPEFSKSYCLKGADDQHIRSFFNDARLSLMQESKGWNIFSSGRFFCAYKKASRVAPEEYLSFIEEVKNLISRLGIS